MSKCLEIFGNEAMDMTTGKITAVSILDLQMPSVKRKPQRKAVKRTKYSNGPSHLPRTSMLTPRYQTSTSVKHQRSLVWYGGMQNPPPGTITPFF